MPQPKPVKARLFVANESLRVLSPFGDVTVEERAMAHRLDTLEGKATRSPL